MQQTTISKQKLNQLLEVVSQQYDIPASEIMGQSRKRHVVRARWELARKLRGNGEHSYSEIGRALGGYDHTSVLYMCDDGYRSRKHAN